jgi:hypothetical protein
MSFKLIESALGELAGVGRKDLKYARSVKYGVRMDLQFKAASNNWESTGRRPAAHFGNDATIFGKCRGELVESYEIPDGLNSASLDDAGNLSEELFADAIRLSYRIEGDHKQKLFNRFVSYEGENSVSVIYNMLRLYYFKKLQEQNIVVNQGDIWYDDGHVRMNYRRAFGSFTNTNLKDIEITGNIDMERINAADCDSNIDGVGVLYYNLEGWTDKMKRVLELAVSEFPDRNVPVLLLHPSPQLADYVADFSLSAGHDGSISWNDISKADLYNTIVKFVMSNRLQADFDMAYGMITQVLYDIKPRSLEAHYWLGCTTEVHMPRPASRRGLHPFLVGGTPAVSRAVTWGTFTNWAKYPSRALIHGIALSEACAVSMFETVRDRIGTELDTFLEEYIGGVKLSHSGFPMAVSLLKTRFGLDECTVLPCQYGRDYQHVAATRENVLVEVQVVDALAENLYGLERIEAIAANEDTGSVAIPERIVKRLNRPAPLCYPVLSIGVNVNEVFLNGMDYEFKSNVLKEGNLALNTVEFLQFGATMRAAGYDIVGQRRGDAVVARNWAANADGRHMAEYVPLANEKHDMWDVDLDDIVKRDNSWLDIYTITDTLSVSMVSKSKGFFLQIEGNDVRTTGAAISMFEYKPDKGKAIVTKPWHEAYAGINIRPLPSLTAYADFMSTWTTTELAEGRLLG